MPSFGLIFDDELIRNFLLIITGLAGLLLFRRRNNPSLSTNIDRIAPGLLTTVGVFGTFYGIFIGLQQFDVTAIQESVPALLDGLKLAFATSIYGMFLAVIWRIFVVYQQSERQSDDPEPSQIYDALLAIRDSSSGLRDELVSEFRNFAENITETNSKALIEALESVIRDFNTKLNEQFGENFKQLKESMDKLLVWQENYKTYIEEMERRISLAVGAIERSNEAIASIATSSEKIPLTMKSLEEVLNTQRSQIDEINDRLSTFAQMKEKAEQAFPVIEDNIRKLTSDFSRNIDDASAEIKVAATEYRAVFEEVRQNYDSLGEEFRVSIHSLREQSEKVIENIGQEINRILEKQTASFSALGVGFDRLALDVENMAEGLSRKSQDLATRFEEIADRQQETIESMSRDMQQALNEGVASATQANKKLVQELVKDSMEELKGFTQSHVSELSKEFEGSGRQLISISEELARNWQRVAEALPENVHLERRETQ